MNLGHLADESLQEEAESRSGRGEPHARRVPHGGLQDLTLAFQRLLLIRFIQVSFDDLKNINHTSGISYDFVFFYYLKICMKVRQ